MATEEIGGVSVAITGDYSQLQQAFDAATTIAKSAGINIGSAFTSGASGVAAVGAVIAGVGAAAFKAALEFDEAFDKIRAASGKVGASLSGLEDAFKNVFQNVPATSQQVAAAISEISQRTGAMGVPLEKLTEQLLNLSNLTGQSIQPLVAATTRLFGDWSIATSKQAESLDTLFKVTQQTGIQFQRLTELVVQFGAPLRALGFSFEEAAVMMGKWEKEGVNLETVLSGLRFALGNFSKAGDEPAEAFRRVVEQIKNAGSETEGLAITFENFGKRAATDMFRAIKEGRFDLDELIKSIKESSETIAKATVDTRSFGEEWSILSNRLTAGLAKIGQPLLEATNSVLTFIRELGNIDREWEDLENRFNKFRVGDISQFDDLNEVLRQGRLAGESFSQTIKSIPDAMKLGSGGMTDYGISVKILKDKVDEANPSLDKLAKHPKEIASATNEAQNSIDKFLSEWTKLFTEAELSAKDLEQAARSIAKAAYEAYDAMGQVPPTFSTSIAEIAQIADEAGISLKVMIPPNLGDNLKAVGEGAKGMGNQISEGASRLKDAMRDVMQAVGTISTGLAEAIVHWDGFGKAIITTLQNIGKAILTNIFDRILESSGAMDKLFSGFEALLKATGLFRGIFGGGSGSGEVLREGGGILGGVIQGAGEGSGEAGGVFGPVIDAIRGGAATTTAAVQEGTKVATQTGASVAGSATSMLSTVSQISAVVSAVAGVVNAVSSIFQSSEQNKTLDLIEHNTRYTEINFKEFLGLSQTYLPKLLHLVDIWGAIGDSRHFLNDISGNTAAILGALAAISSKPGEPAPGPVVTPDLPQAVEDSDGIPLGTFQAFQHGGIVANDTAALLHAEEMVLPPELSRKIQAMAAPSPFTFGTTSLQSQLYGFVKSMEDLSGKISASSNRVGESLKAIGDPIAGLFPPGFFGESKEGKTEEKPFGETDEGAFFTAQFDRLVSSGSDIRAGISAVEDVLLATAVLSGAVGGEVGADMAKTLSRHIKTRLNSLQTPVSPMLPSFIWGTPQVGPNWDKFLDDSVSWQLPGGGLDQRAQLSRLQDSLSARTSAGSGRININVNAFDPAPRAMGHAIVEELQNNGIYR